VTTGQKKSPHPPAGSRSGGLPGQVSFAGQDIQEGEEKDEVDTFIDEELGAHDRELQDDSVHHMLINKESKWVKFTRGDKAFFQNTGIKGLNSLRMPKEGIRGEKVLDEGDDNTLRSFQKNYDKASKMDEMKTKARAETGVWGSMVKQATGAKLPGESTIAEGDEEPEPAPAGSGGISGPPDAVAAHALALKMAKDQAEAETRAAEAAN